MLLKLHFRSDCVILSAIALPVTDRSITQYSIVHSTYSTWRGKKVHPVNYSIERERSQRFSESSFLLSMDACNIALTCQFFICRVCHTMSCWIEPYFFSKYSKWGDWLQLSFMQEINLIAFCQFHIPSKCCAVKQVRHVFILSLSPLSSHTFGFLSPFLQFNKHNEES